MSRFQARPLEPGEALSWDEFVEMSNNGTLFHRQDFLAYHPPDRFQREDLVLQQDGRLKGLLPLARTREGARVVGISPYGGSYGGLITGHEKSGTLIEMTTGLLEYLIHRGYSKLRVGSAPMVYHKRQDVSAEYFLTHRCPSRLVQRRITSVIPLEDAKCFSAGIRRKINRAKREGVSVEMSRDVKTLYPMLQESVETKHGSRLTHSLSELADLVSRLETHIEVAIAFQGETPFAGVLCFLNSSPCVMAFYNGLLRDFQHPSGLAPVFDFLVDHYKQREKRFLDLGASSMLGKYLNRGLLQFKEGLGARHWYRDTYELDLNRGIG